MDARATKGDAEQAERAQATQTGRERRDRGAGDRLDIGGAPPENPPPRPPRATRPRVWDADHDRERRLEHQRLLIREAIEADCSLEGVDLDRLARASAHELAQRLDLPLERARRLEACFRLGREVERSRLPARPRMTTPENVVALLGAELRGLDREYFVALLLDGRHRLFERRTVSVGTLTSSLVHPREVFGPALQARAAAVVVAHNHPSGDPEPSHEDLEVTRRLRDVGTLVGVPLIDHVVFGHPGYVSLRRRGWLA